MTDQLDLLVMAAFALLVTGVAMVYPPAALGVAALFFLGLAVINYRNKSPEA